MSIAQQQVAADARRDAIEACGRLTSREKEMLVLVSKGLSQSDVASMLGLSKRTVEARLIGARNRLGVDTLIEAAVLAAKAGLV